MEYVAKQRGIPTSQIWRWYSRYKTDGFPGLANRIRSDKSQSRFFQKFPDVAQFAQAKYLGERVSIARAHEAIVAEWNKGTFNDISGEPPHYDTVRAYLQALPRPISIMAHDGERQFHERCAPYILVDYAKMQPNEEWVCDHAQHDVWLLNDCLPGYEKYIPLRPYVTAIIDMRTRLVLSAVWSVNPSSHTISSTLRRAILQWGLPQTFYVDNGKDFLSVSGTKLGRIDLSPECSGVLTQLGIAARHCLPKHPQSKNIERFFGTMHSRFDRLWGDFYCGTSPATRPEVCDEALKQHHALVKAGKMQQSRIPRVSEFISLCQDWMEHEYNNTPHSGRGMKNEATGDDYTPLDIFNEMLPIEKRKLIQNHPDSPHALNALFWKVERRKVSEGGCVTLDGRRYEPADQESYGELFSKIERDVLVACDPADMGEALALDLDRRVIGRMQRQALIARGPVSADDIRDGLRRQRRARRVVRDYLDSLSPQHGTELDRMRRNSRRMPVETLPAPEVVAMSLKKAAGETEMYIDDIVNKFLGKGGD